MATLVTDPAVLAQLNGAPPSAPADAPPSGDSYTPGYTDASGTAHLPQVVIRGATPTAPPAPQGTEVTDPAILQQLNGAPTYQPSSVPGMDQINAFANSATDAIPIVGPWLTQVGNNVDAGFNNALMSIPGNPFGLASETPQDRAAINAGEQSQFPIASGAGTVAGTVAPFLMAAPGGVAAKMLGMEGALPSRMLAGGLSSGAIGGVDALARGESPQDAGFTALADAAGGSLAAPVADAVGHVLGRAGEPVSRTMGDLFNAKEAAYKAADNLGVRYSPQSYRNMVIQLVGDAHAAGVSADRHPAVVSMLKDLSTKVRNGYSPTLGQLDTDVRQVISRDVAGSADRPTAMFGKKMIEGVDNFIDNATPADMISGDPVKAAETIRAARAANTTLRKTEQLHEALMKAERRAARTGSGGNINNAMRQNIDAILNKGARGFSPVEKALMDKIVRGGRGENILRLLGKASPEGNGLIGLMELFAAGHDLRAAVVPAAGFIAKRAADGITENRAKLLEAMVSHGTNKAPIKSPVALALIRRGAASSPMLENRAASPAPFAQAVVQAVPGML